jgi:hypothetical protein
MRRPRLRDLVAQRRKWYHLPRRGHLVHVGSGLDAHVPLQFRAPARPSLRLRLPLEFARILQCHAPEWRGAKDEVVWAA